MAASLFPPSPPCGAAPAPPALFKSSDALQKLFTPKFVSPSARMLPIPTNEWWGNLMAWDGQRESDAIFGGAYTYKVVQGQPGAIGCGLSVSYLHQYRVDGPVDDNGGPRFYFYPPTIKNWLFSAVELGVQTAAPPLSIDGWDDLGVHLSMATSASAGMKMYLALGTTFTTVEYQDLQPQLCSDHVITAINGAAVRDGQHVEGTSFQVTLNNGQLWVLFFFPSAGSGVTLCFQNNKLTTSTTFTGVVQMAFVSSTAAFPPGTPEVNKTPQDDRKILELYHSSAGVYPTGVSVKNLDAESFAFNWQLATAAGCAHGARFLHFALTHVQEMLDPSTAEAKPQLVLHAHTRGPMVAYALVLPSADASPQWLCRVPKTTSEAVEKCTSFYPPRQTPLSKDEVAKLDLCRVVTDEIHGDWSSALPHEGSYYFKGKALQKFGTMCLVAQQLAMTTHPEMQQVAKQGITKLQQLLVGFASNTSAYPLVYDTVFKGITTSEATAKHDMNVDFGNGVYNDHHYHYGYIVTAAAMALHLDPTWRHSQDAVKVRTFVDGLIRDVVTATPAGSDAYFPRFRMFNWWLGHSYSHGVTPLADGKDEESTSEEVNFFYGLAVYAQVTEHAEQQALAKLMLKVYTRAVNTYFLLQKAGPRIHPDGFAKNKITGIFFDNKCDYTTWFSPNKECIHGIQMLPVSPILEATRDPRFVKEEWDEVLGKLAFVKDWKKNQNGWTSLLFSNYSVLDSAKACEVLAECPMDDGLSRAWALYYAATRPAPSC